MDVAMLTLAIPSLLTMAVLTLVILTLFTMAVRTPARTSPQVDLANPNLTLFLTLTPTSGGSR